MTHPLQVGQLLYAPALTGNTKGHHYRIVDLESQLGGRPAIAHLILLPDKGAPGYDHWPEPRPLDSLANDLFRGRLVVEDPANDHWQAPMAIPESLIKELHKQRRDHRWWLVEPLVLPRPTDLCYRGPRWAAISKRSNETGTRPPTIIRALKLYFVHGLTPNALLPKWERCGGRGKARPAKHPRAPKPGARKSLANTTGANGVALTPSIRAKIIEGFELYLLGRNEDQEGRVSKVTPVRSLREAYEKTIFEIFRAESERDADGNLPKANDIPSIHQFRYLVRRHCAENGISILKERTDARDWNLKHKPAAGSERVGINGPGEVYAVDYTLADVYLVDEATRTRVVGRPVLYTVMDVWSSRFVSIFASLKYGWDALAVALRIAFGAKTAILDELGVAYTSDDLVRGVPNQLVGDRGELISHDANNMTTALILAVNNTPPYRADIKGIEERGFRVLLECDLRWEPGATYPKRRRGGKDYRLDAQMTVRDFNKYVWEKALHHNRAHRIKDNNQLPRDIPLPSHDPTPNELWNLGATSLHGDLRLYSQELINAALLHADTARLHQRGIYYKGLYYAPTVLFDEDGRPNYDIDNKEIAAWFERNTGRRTPRQLDIGFDPSNVARLVVRLDKGRRLVPCRLTQGAERFRGLSIEEVEDYRIVRRQATQLLEDADLDEAQRHHEAIAATAAEAERQTKDKRGNAHADISAIRDSRREENTKHPHGGIEALQDTPRPDPKDAPQKDPDEDDTYDLTDLLRQQRDNTPHPDKGEKDEDD